MPHPDQAVSRRRPTATIAVDAFERHEMRALAAYVALALLTAVMVFPDC